jgi:hypothetical protein
MTMPIARLGLEDTTPDLISESAVLHSPTEGLVTRTLAGKPSSFRVVFDGDGERLASIQSLGTDSTGYTYVLLEVGKLAPGLHIRRIARKYAADGHIAAEVRDIPNQRDVSPTAEFRVRDGVLYQLVVAANQTSINQWDLRNLQ